MPKSLQPYIGNVRKAIFRNIVEFTRSLEEEEGSEVERFLQAVENYCDKLRMNKDSRVKRRVRTRHALAGAKSKRSGSKQVIKEVIHANE